MEDREEILDSGNSIDVLYLDFKKAFDSVPHKRLLRKLFAYGIRSKLLTQIRAFLQGQRQCVSLNGTFLSWSDVLSGRIGSWPFIFTILLMTSLYPGFKLFFEQF